MLKHRKSRVAPPPPQCSLTTCLSFLAGHWTPNILWYLQEEPRRFNELKRDVAGISSKVLAHRLRRLESDALVARRVVATSPPSVEYSLTDLGRRLRPVLDALVEVGDALKRRKARER